jgi:glycosyltransferase involved in cell wall biosynthesis
MRHRASSELSILVPVYNEVDSLPQLYEEICRASAATVSSFEIIFVDDGSSDGSAEAMDRLADQDPRVTVIHLRRNFGKSPALAAGFQRARGEIIITMDADLQDDPAMIPDFVRMIRAGADLVSGWKQRRHDPLDKTFPSRIFNYVVRRTSGVQLHDFNCGFKAYRAACARELRVYGGFHRFLPVFAHDRGFKVEELVVQHRPRVHGQSKFGKKRLIEGLLDLPTVLLLTRYRMRPLHFFGFPGALVSAVGFVILSYLTALWALGHPIGTRPLLALGVLLMITGVQILCVGLVAELIVRTSSGRSDVFAVREVRTGSRSVSGRERRAELTRQ